MSAEPVGCSFGAKASPTVTAPRLARKAPGAAGNSCGTLSTARDATRAFENVATSDFLPDALDLLVDDGLPLADHAGGRVQHEVALGVHLELVGSLEAEADPLGIGARTDDEIVFELALGTVVDQIDPRVDVLVSHLRVGRDVGPPVRGIAAH